MKRNLSFLTLFALLFLTSCQFRGDLEKELLTLRLDSLSRVNEENARQLSDVNSIVDVISEELDSIAIMEDMIRLNPLGNEGRQTSRAEMRQRLRAFSEMLNRQKQRIAQLEDSLSGLSNKTIQRYRSLVTLLNSQLEEKDRTINDLMARLNTSNARISDLESSVEELTSTNEQLASVTEMQQQALTIQDNIINEGYIKVGSKKELQNVGLLTGGGFLSKAKVNSSGFDPNLFIKVDIREFTELPIQSKSIQILTSMPASSYSIERSGNTSVLRILDPTSFWSVSRFLIIQTK